MSRQGVLFYDESMATFQKIIEKFKKNGHPEEEIKLIQKAYQFAANAHRGQKRVSGENYISHCLSTAETLVDLNLDSETIAAAFLHDVLDDTKTTSRQIKKEFGENVLRLVEGICKIDRMRYQGNERMVENFRKLILATAKDIRVILIKLADRLHNMRTLAVLSEEKKKRIALETLEIYAPIAYRLGMGEFKGQLEDLAFPYVYPKKYQRFISLVGDKYEERKKYLKEAKETVEEYLKKESVKIIDIHFRAKHYYSLYKKLQRHDMDLYKIYDLVALRIIVPEVEDCYNVLGLIHKIWKPLPSRIKDYIALPKPNGYQSLHTTVFAPKGEIVEIQIRTEKMHQKADFGIAAHWHYSEQKGLKKYFQKILQPNPRQSIAAPISPVSDISWIQQLRQWQKGKFNSPDEFLKSLKIDFFKDRIFVFTPKGDIINLPEGATAIDFAYQIHSDVGHRCAGVKIDGKLSSFKQTLENGQIVEIIIQKNKKPSRDWLNFVKTNQAKNMIRAWFKKNT